MEYTLTVRRNGEVLFQSGGKWLHPLLDLEEAIQRNGWNPADLDLEDKIVGKAAAFLIVRMGIPRVSAHLLSELAVEVFRRYGVCFRWNERIPRIACQTEQILANIDDPEEAALVILRRAGRDREIPLVVESLFVYRENRPILQNLTFAASRGDRVVIRGANGSGKSTLLRAILGLLPIEKGTILIQGKHTRDPEGIGYLAQGGGGIDLNISVEEAVEVGTIRYRCSQRERKERIQRALSITGMDTLRKRTLRSLSGGERRRTELSRLFAQEPAILLLDEPTTNLDPKAKQEVLEVLQRYAEDRKATIVMVSHEEIHFHLPGWRYRLLSHGRLYPEDSRTYESQWSRSSSTLDLAFPCRKES
ncbi:MAG: DUF1893 domain-containing protein [Spirochaetes bacterium]|nr:DUF1893 domain-containing protein [Spirochaetota bacterium]